MTNHDLLFRLLEKPSPTGFETEGQRVWLDFMKTVSDETSYDAYGTAWGTLKGTNPSAPSLMLEAHVDEVGFMVSHVMPDGFLRLRRLGYPDSTIARSKRIIIAGDRGKVTGIIGCTALHLRERHDEERVPKMHDLFVDIGAKSADEVKAMGIRIGNPAVYADGAEYIGEFHVVGRALDNSVGSYMIARVLEELHAAKPPCTLHAVNAIQEEIGGFGATMATDRLKPQLAIVIDVTHATDTPGIEESQHGKIHLGSGPAITHGRGNHPKMIQRLVKLADENNIPLQHQASPLSTSTDTDAIYPMLGGIPSVLLSIPLRYMHSTVEMADLRDIDHGIALLVAFAKSCESVNDFRVDL